MVPNLIKVIFGTSLQELSAPHLPASHLFLQLQVFLAPSLFPGQVL